MEKIKKETGKLLGRYCEVNGMEYRKETGNGIIGAGKDFMKEAEKKCWEIKLM